MTVLDRLLKYVSIWTTSDEESSKTPSTKRQFDLAKLLENELKELGLEKILLDDKCYLYAMLPASKGLENRKAVGFIAHMDTAPDYNGKDVCPQIIENYNGKDVLLKGSGDMLSVKEFPDLLTLTGRTLITTDGNSLLGADDKAGIAVIMTALEEIISQGMEHGDIWVGFTPDEEIGRGADYFNLDYFKADYAYTVDGGYEGEVAYENFNAAGAVFTVKGVNVHPGEAKDIMINAALVGSEIASMLPADEIPAKTEGRQGFYHLTDFNGDVSKAVLQYIVRDHDQNIFENRMQKLREVEEYINKKYGDGTVSLTIKHSYSNMIAVMEKNMQVVDLAKEAIRENGLEPVSEPVRGGTDGARLSFMGLPCPNLGAGGYGFHGPFEHISLEGMELSVKIMKSIIGKVM